MIVIDRSVHRALILVMCDRVDCSCRKISFFMIKKLKVDSAC